MFIIFFLFWFPLFIFIFLCFTAWPTTRHPLPATRLPATRHPRKSPAAKSTRTTKDKGHDTWIKSWGHDHVNKIVRIVFLKLTNLIYQQPFYLN